MTLHIDAAVTGDEVGLGRRWVLAAIALALTLRLAAIFVLGTWRSGPIAAGAYEHDVIARSLIEGTGFAFPFYASALEPTATQAPLVPALVALAYSLFGVASPAALLAVQCVNALLVVPAMWGVVQVTRWLVKGREGHAGVSLASWQAFSLVGFAGMPAFVYMVTRVQSINMSVCGLLFVLGLFARFAERPGAARRAVAAGVGVAVVCLAEPILAMPLGLAWWGLFFIAPGTPARGAWGHDRLRPVVIPLVAAACVLPWVVRNTSALGEPTFIKSSFWYVFWQGNHVGASGTDKRRVDDAIADELRWRVGGRGLETSLEAARQQAVSVDSVLGRETVDSLRALPGETERMAWFGERIRSELSQQPGHYAAMIGRRLVMIAWFDPTNPRSFALPYRLPYLVVAAAALAGLALRGRPRGPDGVFLLAVIGLVVALAGIITSARFRLMIEAWMLLPAGFAAAALCQQFWPRTSAIAVEEGAE